jgi:magnesium transporter
VPRADATGPTEATVPPPPRAAAGRPDGTTSADAGHPRILDDRGEVNDHVSRQDVERLLAEDRVFWLDLPAMGEEEVTWLRDVFKFHPLAVEDAEQFGERPKLEEYDGYVTMVLYGSGAPVTPAAAEHPDGERGQVGPGVDPAPSGSIDPDDLEALTEVHCFLAEQYIVTVHQANCPAFSAMLDRAHARKVKVTDTSRLFYRAADTLVDSFFPILAELDDRIDTLQAQVIERPDNAQLGELLGYRSALIALRRVITPQRDLFASLSSQVTDLPGFEDDEIRYLRDVYDHLIRLSDMIDGYRDLLSGTTDAYLSVVSNQLNVVMKQLAIISTVFLPLAFITGFFGQNFGWLVGHIGGGAVFVWLGLGTELVAVVLLMLLFKRRGWIGGQT